MTQPADIKTDYLVIGAGACGMAFADELVAQDSGVDVVLVDRHHQPGGHWNDAYPFVRLHQPSAYYGVNSRRLGFDKIDTTGPNKGFYERAGGAEICDYYRRVLEEQLEATGRVRFLERTVFTGDLAAPRQERDAEGRQIHRVQSLLDGRSTTIGVRRRLVNATYLQSIVPATHRLPFAVEGGADETGGSAWENGPRVLTPGDLTHLDRAASSFTVIGGGKTSMDACIWLLDHGVDPDTIRWIRPHDGWFVDRHKMQPHDLAAGMAEYQADMVEAAAAATGPSDYALRLEAKGHFIRLDPDVEPIIYRGAIVDEREVAKLRSIKNVVRLGYVRAIRRGVVEMTEGEVPVSPGEVFIDCTAQGLATAAPRPIFSGDKITVQHTAHAVVPWSAAIIGFVEALDVDDETKNRLCPPVHRTGKIADELEIVYLSFLAERERQSNPQLASWMKGARLNPSHFIAERKDDPRVHAAMTRMAQHLDAAMTNLAKFH